MAGFRARDEDRDRTVEAIEAAYVDGQLGAQDRELRVGRALTAASLDELDALTRDLQVPAAPDVVRHDPAPPARTRRPVGARVALVAAAVGVLGIVPFVFLATGSSDLASSTGVETVAVAPPAVEQQVVEQAAFAMTPPGVRAFLRSYEDQFGTLDVYEAGLYPTRVGVQVPVRGARPRFERWSYDGTWRQETLPSAMVRPGGVVDLGSLDVRRLFANIATAKKVLRVPRGELTHVLVNRWFDDAAAVNIHVANASGESGVLKTAPSGEAIRGFPHGS